MPLLRPPHLLPRSLLPRPLPLRQPIRSQFLRSYASTKKGTVARGAAGASDDTASSGSIGLRLQAPEHLDEQERHVFEKLVKELGPMRLEVQDVSGGCGSMYAIEVASEKFKGLTTVKQHRLVNDILANEIKGWHGVQLRTKAE